MGLVVGGVYFTQNSKSATTQARRFYRRIQQRPVDTLKLLEEKYEEVDGSPTFFCNWQVWPGSKVTLMSPA
ncbi:MAG: hypothetical protein R3C44_04840 [Chloroflexota bacterium]